MSVAILALCLWRPCLFVDDGLIVNGLACRAVTIYQYHSPCCLPIYQDYALIPQFLLPLVNVERQTVRQVH